MEQKTQEQYILTQLMNGRCITPKEMYHECSSMNLAQRIYCIKKKLSCEYEIETKMVNEKSGLKYARYVMYGPGVRRKF